MYLPITGSAGASLWGTDVRAMLTAADATADATSTCAHGLSGDTRRTVDPYTASATDETEGAFGWAIDAGSGAAGMGSTAAAKRKIASGNHVFTGRLSHSATLGDATATLHFFAYRVGPAASRTRTLLGSVDQAINLGVLGAIATYTATIALPEIVFENDETIQYSYEITAAGQVVTGASSTFRTGTEGGVAIRVDFPELRTIAEATGASAGIGAGSGALQTTANMQGASAGIATAAATLGATKESTGAAAGIATAAATLAGVANMQGASAGVATVAATLAAVANLLGASAGVATASAELQTTANMQGDSAGVATASGALAAVKETIGQVDGLATVSGVAARVVPTVGTSTVGGGGTTLRPVYVFDD